MFCCGFIAADEQLSRNTGRPAAVSTPLRLPPVSFLPIAVAAKLPDRTAVLLVLLLNLLLLLALLVLLLLPATRRACCDVKAKACRGAEGDDDAKSRIEAVK